ncbi:MAG: asparagine synthase (glutamine-hydrolyzing) [Chitinophagaceae bacterium]|nr:asparagine synthase (glutamine-hydrolyzing) [Chitinophagaceae bacterium]
MCGIAGYFYKSGKRISDTATVIKMLQVQHHRGPDDSGLRAFSLKNRQSREYVHTLPQNIESNFEGLLGFNRLSILDLSKNGHQPMCSSDEQVMLTLNGEIYNAFDFTDELKASGFQFKSTTDTEVVLYLYLKYGFEGMVTRLNGMFSIVVVDLGESKIFIARDRFGIKPMYLFETNDLLAFSSEIKSFLPLDEFKPVLNRDLLDEYLFFRHTINQSLFKGVELLEPGTFKTYSLSATPVTTKYFDIEGYHRSSVAQSFDDTIAQLKTGMHQSVNSQLMSDVKLGCQLSGGVDSSLVTWFARDIKNDGLFETVSVVFDDARVNEEPYMDKVTNQLSLTAHKFLLDASYYADCFEKATWHFEGPLNHPNTIGIYLLSEQAKKYVTVLLSGEGADEVFGGYGRFTNVNYPYHLRTFLSGLKKNRDTALQYITSYFSAASRTIMGYNPMTLAFAKQLKTDFSFDKAVASRKEIYHSLSGSVFDKQVKYEIKTYLPDLLIRQDKMSMAHSIENRVPFLDNDLVKQSFTIPQEHLLPKQGRERNTKYALKKLTASLFGDEAFAFREKQGFGIPLRSFFKDKKMNRYLSDQIIPGIEQRKIFNSDILKHWMKNLDTVSVHELEALWIMIAFEAWAKKFNIA